MLTTEERAMEILDQIHGCQDVNNRISIIEKALKEQDKITRHDCRKAVEKMKSVNNEAPALVKQASAVQTIINTKSI